MQYKNSEYNPDLHDKWHALTVRQPYAQHLVTAAYVDDDGTVYGEKSIEVRSRATNYRGDLLVCSSATPVIPGMESGVTLGIVEVYDVRPIETFTEQDWQNTCIPVDQRPKKGYGWFVRNPRRVVEMPVKGQLGIYNLVCPKDDITVYPTACHVDKESWQIITSKIKNGKGE